VRVREGVTARKEATARKGRVRRRSVRKRRVRQRLIAKRSYGLAKSFVEAEAGALCGGREGMASGEK
jgi:hypothetical protein